MVLAWLLVLFAPVVAAFVAQRRYKVAGAAPAPDDRGRQVLGAGLLANLVGALLVAALGTGTTALMVRAAWLQNWLYHGQRQFFGIAGLRSLLRGNLAGIAYSHELTGAVDESIFLAMCVAFPVFALALIALPALDALGSPETEPERGRAATVRP